MGNYSYPKNDVGLRMWCLMETASGGGWNDEPSNFNLEAAQRIYDFLTGGRGINAFK